MRIDNLIEENKSRLFGPFCAALNLEDKKLIMGYNSQADIRVVWYNKDERRY